MSSATPPPRHPATPPPHPPQPPALPPSEHSSTSPASAASPDSPADFAAAAGLHAPVAGPIDLIHLDDQLVVLHKPAGLPVTPERTAQSAAAAAGAPPDTLTNRLWHYLIQRAAAGGGADAGGREAAVSRPLIVHRLDRDVSGVIVFARTAQAHRDLSRQFEAHTVRKTYVGVVSGRLQPAAGEINLAIGPLPKPNHRTRGRIFVNAPGAKLAHTRYRTLEALPAHSLVELTPTTGRRHQLRVHLAAQEHPLIGDPVYAKKQPAAEWPAALTAAGHPPRVALHAQRLQFRHPGSGEPFECSAGWPVDLQALLTLLRDPALKSGSHPAKR